MAGKKVSRRDLEKIVLEQRDQLQSLTLLLSAIAWRDGGVVIKEEDLKNLPGGEFVLDERKDGSVALLYKRAEHVKE